MSLLLILSGRVVAQPIQNRPPDHDHPAFTVPAAKPFTASLCHGHARWTGVYGVSEPFLPQA
jgi:hypothetical protein